MKLQVQQVNKILNLLKQGKSSRTIAQEVGCCKSTVNNVRSEYKDKSRKGPRILILDLETSADIVATFGRKNINISESNIINQGNEIISAAWKWSDQETVFGYICQYRNFNINKSDEKYLIANLTKQLKRADAVIIHNARFDLGTIQHRMLYYKMGKLPSVKIIDTLQIARKYLKLRSNKLDSITKYFNLSNKMENEGISLWIKTQSGDQKSASKMLEYNKQDVVALDSVYKTLQPLAGSSFNLGLFNENTSCTSCGSESVFKTGNIITTGVSAFEEYSCSDCGNKMRSRKNILTKTHRDNLLVSVN